MFARAWISVVALLAVLTCLGCDATLLPEPRPDHPLVGHAAPLFTGETLDEQPFDLARYIGKDVVILDFWATWCGPCTRSLPAVSEVAAEYRNQGVVFFAVDIGETREEIQQFLKTSSLDLSVVMDQDGAISDLYQVEPIPHTAVIGLDGKVHFVNIGASGNLKAELSEQLDSLVAGQ